MKIKSFNTAAKILIVAEIGNNHEGRFDVAKELVKQAARSGVDAVKFQTFRTEHYVAHADSARFDRLKSFELTMDQFRELAELARSFKLLFLSTPFDIGSAQVLRPIVDAYKISSGDLPFFPLISEVLKAGKPTLFSTGASDRAMVDRTVQFIKKELKGDNWTDRIALLHCVASYPVPPAQAGLRAITAMADRFPCTIGYSDHVVGVEASVAAAALGARIIEKHFTMGKNFSAFRDHQLSADPAEMTELVKRVRAVEEMLGTAEKIIQPCESEGVKAFRRSIIAARDLTAGTVLKLKDLTWVRPAGGFAPGQERRLIGKKLRRSVPAGHRFEAGDVR